MTCGSETPAQPNPPHILDPQNQDQNNCFKTLCFGVIIQWKIAEYATPEYAYLAYRLSWADCFWETADTEEALKTEIIIL